MIAEITDSWPLSQVSSPSDMNRTDVSGLQVSLCSRISIAWRIDYFMLVPPPVLIFLIIFLAKILFSSESLVRGNLISLTLLNTTSDSLSKVSSFSKTYNSVYLTSLIFFPPILPELSTTKTTSRGYLCWLKLMTSLEVKWTNKGIVCGLGRFYIFSYLDFSCNCIAS